MVNVLLPRSQTEPQRQTVQTAARGLWPLPSAWGAACGPPVCSVEPGVGEAPSPTGARRGRHRHRHGHPSRGRSPRPGGSRAPGLRGARGRPGCRWVPGEDHSGPMPDGGGGDEGSRAGTSFHGQAGRRWAPGGAGGAARSREKATRSPAVHSPASPAPSAAATAPDALAPLLPPLPPAAGWRAAPCLPGNVGADGLSPEAERFIPVLTGHAARPAQGSVQGWVGGRARRMKGVSPRALGRAAIRVPGRGPRAS